MIFQDFKLTKKYNEEEFNHLVDKMKGNDRNFVFSICKDVEFVSGEDEDWEIMAPNIESRTPVFKGKVVLSGQGYTSGVITNPKWKDIIVHASQAAGIDHRFLEGIYLEKSVRGVKHYRMFFGS